jgi:wobble nucleotide-excising tRNase
MLTKIKKIKNFGVFDNYTADATLPKFTKHNIIYGQNGSGKTTLSRLFSCLEKGEHPEYPDLEYEIETESSLLKQKIIYSGQIRVFNSDFVKENIGDFDGPIPHILIVGSENKVLAEEIKADRNTLNERDKRLASITATTDIEEKQKGKLFTEIAKTITEAISGSALRNYRKNNAEEDYAKLSGDKIITEDELAVHRVTVKQEPMEEVDQLAPILIRSAEDEIAALDLAATAAARAQTLLAKTAQAAVIERLAENPPIAIWVEQGFHLHNANENKNCEFCDQPLPKDRLEALSNHFSIEDQKLKEALENERLSLEAILQSLLRSQFPDPLAIYSELRSKYNVAVNSYNAALQGLLFQLEQLDNALLEKLTLRTTVVERNLASDATPLNSAIDNLNAIILEHNVKSKSFEREKEKSVSAIKEYYLRSMKEEVNAFDSKLKKLETEKTLLIHGGAGLPDKRSLEAISLSIADKRAKLSNAHIAAEYLSKHLGQFLGRTDLNFSHTQDGYLVFRHGKLAKRLSEGEKTAIAFLYFLERLKDQNFDLAQGVVVIDDPMSSLDSSAIYQAFAFLKNETSNAKQLFILTHNFEFLKLLINWLERIKKKDGDKTYIMVLCAEKEGSRSARLDSLDRILVEHQTEYQYLFKILYKFNSDGKIANSYHIPNLARKVLETFLEFQVPSKDDLYTKLKKIDFDEYKKTAIYKFANDLSHFTGKGFDPALVAETQKNVGYLLEMIKTTAPPHYGGLEELSKS